MFQFVYPFITGGIFGFSVFSDYEESCFNICKQFCVSTFSFVLVNRSGIAGLYGNSIFIYEKLTDFSKITVPFYIPTTSVWKSQFLNFTNNWYVRVLFCFYFVIRISKVLYWDFILVLIYISLMAIEHLYCSSAIHMPIFFCEICSNLLSTF